MLIGLDWLAWLKRRRPKVLEEWGPTIKMKNIICRKKKNWAGGSWPSLGSSFFLTKTPWKNERDELWSPIWRNTCPTG